MSNKIKRTTMRKTPAPPAAIPIMADVGSPGETHNGHVKNNWEQQIKHEQCNLGSNTNNIPVISVVDRRQEAK